MRPSAMRCPKKLTLVAKGGKRGYLKKERENSPSVIIQGRVHAAQAPRTIPELARRRKGAGTLQMTGKEGLPTAGLRDRSNNC